MNRISRMSFHIQSFIIKMYSTNSVLSKPKKKLKKNKRSKPKRSKNSRKSLKNRWLIWRLILIINPNTAKIQHCLIKCTWITLVNWTRTQAMLILERRVDHIRSRVALSPLTVPPLPLAQPSRSPNTMRTRTMTRKNQKIKIIICSQRRR
jgi:hypothetical protein